MQRHGHRDNTSEYFSRENARDERISILLAKQNTNENKPMTTSEEDEHFFALTAFLTRILVTPLSTYRY